MILNWTNGDIVTLRAATAPLSATSLLAYSSTLPAVKKHLLDWKLQLSTPTPAVEAAPNLRQIGMDFKNGRFRSVVVCCYTGLRFYFWGGGQFCYRGLRGASFLKSNWVRVYRKGVLKSQCAVVRGCEHCEETKCCRFRNSCGTLCGLHCTAPHPLSLVARVCCGVVPAQLHRTHSLSSRACAAALSPHNSTAPTLSRRARVLRRCPRTTCC